MSSIIKKSLSWFYYRAAIPLAFGVAGYAINCLPIEIFPGIHLIFGSIASIIAAMRFGPYAGGVAGFVAGLRTWTLWNQPFPFSACLYALEGVWVGYHMNKGKRAPLTAIFLYWVLLGAWLNLAGQLLLHELPLRLALIVQARSVINGLLTGLLLESGILIYEALRRRRAQEPARLSLNSLVTLVMAATITLPLLYITTSSIHNVREKMMSDMYASSMRDVAAVEAEVHGLMQDHERGLTFASALLTSPHHKTNVIASTSKLLQDIREEFPDLQAMYVTDANLRITAADPLRQQEGQDIIGIDLSGIPYYRNMLRAESMIYMGVYYENRVMTGPAMIVSKPLLDQKRNILGYVFACVSTDKFHSILSRYKEDGESLIITDREGRLIANSSQSPDTYQSVSSLADRKDFAIANQSRDGVGSYSDGIGDVRSAASAALDDTYVVRYTTILPAGWKIWERQSLKPLKSKLDGFYVEYLLVLVLALILALVFSKAVARLFTKPIIQLQDNASRLTAGNLSGPRQSRPLLTAEYDSLFRSFYEMSERLEAGWARQQELLHEVSIAKGELEATFDAMTDAVIITDLEDRVLRANRAYYKLRDIDPEQAMGQVLTELGHRNGDWRSCESCVARREGRHAILIKTSVDNPTGRHLEIRVDPIYNLAGERVGAVQVLRDLTEKRLAEAEAEKVSALLRNLADSAYDAVYATDHDGRFLWANKRASDLFGFDSNRLEGEFFLQSIHEGDLERVRASFVRTASGDADRFEARYITGDGSLRQVLVTHTPVYTDNKIVAVLGVVRDLTEERLEVEQLMRDDKLRALGQLASGVAHNFNNSLTAVLGYTQLVLGSASDPKIIRHLKTVETAALDAAKMVQRIQNFARQQQDEPSGPSDLNQIISDALDLTRSRWRDDARAAGIAYDIAFNPTQELIAMCDQSAMREVFVNIIINAMDAMTMGGRITITTAIEGDKAIIRFTDTGCGMTEQVRQRIFEPFYTTKGAKGYGMGLAVTYGIIERHGGSIQVASQAGHGSTFTIKLQLARTRQSDQDELLPDICPKEASILVVDDEAAIRALLRDILRARGHKVLVAEDGLAGLRAIESKRFDMVITDLSMPGVDGWTVASEARRRWPGTKLVIVTGYGGFAELEVPGGDTRSVDALISKPFNIAQIDATISKLLLTVEQVA